MKRFSKMFIVMAIVFSLLIPAGCATGPVLRSSDCTESRIYDAIDAIHIQPDVLSRFLLAADITAIREGLYTPEAALEGIAHIRGILGSGMYSEIYQILGEHFKIVSESKAAGYVSFLLPLIPRINITKVVTKCDQEIISALLDEHESAIKEYLAGK